MRVSLTNRQRKTKLPLRRIERETRKALRLLGLKGVELSLVFASAAAVRKLNHNYRGIDSTTDVLSFPLHEFGGSVRKCRAAAANATTAPGGVLLLGDVVIDPARALRQAHEYGHSLGDEILRLVVHGVLHLLGHDHEGGAYERRKMARAESDLLDAINPRKG